MKSFDLRTLSLVRFGVFEMASALTNLVRSWRRSLWRSVKTRGLSGTCRRIGSIAGNRLSAVFVTSKSQSTISNGDVEDRATDRAFDLEFGVETSEIIPVCELDTENPNWVHASAYVPTSPIDFSAILGAEGICYERTVFVDLGCGKGRVLLMAAALAFKKIVGVEFSSALSAIARDNIERYRGPRLCTLIDIETTDASEYLFPHCPLVVYLYHPFDDAIMARVIDNLRRTLIECPRRILVLYFKPVYAQLWDVAPFVQRKTSTAFYNVYDTGQP